jgi:AcrR family transcriptional regulator
MNGVLPETATGPSPGPQPLQSARHDLRDARAILQHGSFTLYVMARDTRERLLDIGLALFARNGLAATTITEIESQAGLRGGSGSFYRHFGSKEELFFAVVEREIERLQRSFEEGPRGEDMLGEIVVGNVRPIVAIEIRRVLNAIAQRDKLMAIVIRDRPALSPLMDRVHKAMGAGVDINADLLTKLMDAGLIPRREPRTLSVVLTNALVAYQGSSRYYKTPFGGVSVDDYIAALVDLVTT